MKAYSIRQPWAHLIVYGWGGVLKDIENRTRRTNLRGRVLVHASKTMRRADYEAARDMACRIGKIDWFPAPAAFMRGGIIGSVEIVDCVTKSNSPWFEPGGYGYVLANPEQLSFVEVKGQLGFFDVTQPCACRITNLDGVCVECGREVAE